MIEKTHKFMQTASQPVWRKLFRIAKNRGITVQQLIRAVIVPEWYAGYRGQREEQDKTWAKLTGRRRKRSR